MIPFTEDNTLKKKATVIAFVFLDIGGVLLIDEWGHHALRWAALNFKPGSAPHV